MMIVKSQASILHPKIENPSSKFVYSQKIKNSNLNENFDLTKFQ